MKMNHYINALRHNFNFEVLNMLNDILNSSEFKKSAEDFAEYHIKNNGNYFLENKITSRYDIGDLDNDGIPEIAIFFNKDDKDNIIDIYSFKMVNI